MPDFYRTGDDAPEASNGENAAVVSIGAMLEPGEEQMQRINALALTPLRPEQVAVFPVELSNTRLDTWGTCMAPSSLRHYAQDAGGGLPWMNSHRTGFFNAELPHGQIFAGRAEGEGDEMTLREWFYLLRGLTLNGQANDDLIAAMAGGTVRSASIGFTMNPAVAPRAYYRCGLCGLDMARDRDCPHVPLRLYEDALAFAWVEEARQTEGSMVWRGATPGALIGKARAQAAAGLLPRWEVERLEGLYGVRLCPPRAYSLPAGGGVAPRAAAGGDRQTGGSDLELEEIRQQIIAARPDLEAQVRSAGDPVAAVLACLQEVETARDGLAGQLEQAVGRIADLEPAAEDGRAYRADLVEQAVQARVRAQGSNFDVAGYRAQLAGAGLDYVKSEIQAHEQAAGQVFQPGRPTRQNPAQREGPQVRYPHLYK